MLFKVEGMHCGHCVRAVQQAVRSVAPDAPAEVDLGGGTVTIGGNPDASRVVEAISAEGYAARLIHG